MSGEAKLQATRFLAAGVASSTAAHYLPDWARWVEFHRVNGSEDLYLHSIRGQDMARAQVWTLFAYHLFLEGRREGQVTSVLAGVRHHLIAHLESVAFLDQPVVGQARRACRRSVNERRAIAAHQAEAVFLPVSVDMLKDLRAALWKEGDWSFDEVERKAIWLASCLSFDRGLRISNLTRPCSKSAMDHNIQARDASFTVGEGEEYRIVHIGPELEGVAPEAVKALTVQCMSSKTTGGGTPASMLSLVFTRSSPGSEQLLLDCLEFAKHAGVCGSDPLLSYRRVSLKTNRRSHKVLTRSIVNEAIKACAVRCGLPADYFSATSLRKGNPTTTTLAGFSREDRNRAGGWALNSTVPDRHYDHSDRIRGALDAAAGAGAERMGVEQLRLMLPQRTGREPLGRHRHRVGERRSVESDGVAIPSPGSRGVVPALGR
jgi:hypothetical protein